MEGGLLTISLQNPPGSVFPHCFPSSSGIWAPQLQQACPLFSTEREEKRSEKDKAGSAPRVGKEQYVSISLSHGTCTQPPSDRHLTLPYGLVAFVQVSQVVCDLFFRSGHPGLNMLHWIRGVKGGASQNTTLTSRSLF